LRPAHAATTFVGSDFRAGFAAKMSPIRILVVIATAAVLGIGSAWLAVVGGFGFEAIGSGPWTAWPTAGSADADPYVRARIARSGEIPMPAGEGIVFVAREDSDGEALTADCDYHVRGQTPAAQWWTLTVYRDDDLTLMANPAQRYGFVSTGILRAGDGRFDITLSSRARPGNWLPVDPHAGRLRLVFRFYDTPIATGGSVADIAMPAIVKGACR